MKALNYKTNYCLLIISFLLLNFISPITTAAVSLDLNQGMHAAIPMAVIPFNGQDEASNQVASDLTKVITDDLLNCGRFNIPAAKRFAQSPHALKQVNLSYWRHIGMNNIVIGQVSQTNGLYMVKYSLLETYSVGSGGLASHVLASEQFTIKPDQSRRLAHQISDKIYQTITGERGVFNTKLAYILVERGKHRQPVYFLDIADYDGYKPQTLVVTRQVLMSPAWSPDGKNIAFVAISNRQAQIISVNVATGQRRVITRLPGINGAPAWSHDGKNLALVLSKNGYSKIYTVNMASGAVRQLTYGLSLDTEPNWAPNDKSIIFTSNRGGNPQIYRVNIASKQVKRLTFIGNYNARASFDNSGNEIVMLHRNKGGFNIALQNLATGNVRVLTKSGIDESPSIAPNGDMVVYGTYYAGRNVLGMISVDGRVRLRLPAQEGSVQEPAWSPYLG